MSANIDPLSPTWAAVVEHIQKRTEVLRTVVDSIGVDERAADAARGALIELREITDLAKFKEERFRSASPRYTG